MSTEDVSFFWLKLYSGNEDQQNEEDAFLEGGFDVY